MGWHYHGSTLQSPEFKEVRDAFVLTDRANTAKQRYGELQKKSEYSSLPNWQNRGQVSEALEKWEGENPSKCIRKRDDGNFFGFFGIFPYPKIRGNKVYYRNLFFFKNLAVFILYEPKSHITARSTLLFSRYFFMFFKQALKNGGLKISSVIPSAW